MSIKIQTEVWESAELSGNRLVLLLKLADNADEKTRICHPGVPYLMDRTRCSRSQVYAMLKDLSTPDTHGRCFIKKHLPARGTHPVHWKINPRENWPFDIFKAVEY